VERGTFLSFTPPAPPRAPWLSPAAAGSRAAPRAGRGTRPRRCRPARNVRRAPSRRCGPPGRPPTGRLRGPHRAPPTTIAAAGERRSHGSAARLTRAIPTTLTSKTRSHSSSELASTVPCAPMPALLITMSRRPSASAACSTDVLYRSGVRYVGRKGQGPLGARLGGTVEHGDRASGVQQLPGDDRADARAAARADRGEAGEGSAHAWPIS